jgi:hypothetical protein
LTALKILCKQCLSQLSHQCWCMVDAIWKDLKSTWKMLSLFNSQLVVVVLTLGEGKLMDPMKHAWDITWDCHWISLWDQISYWFVIISCVKVQPILQTWSSASQIIMDTPCKKEYQNCKLVKCGELQRN